MAPIVIVGSRVVGTEASRGVTHTNESVEFAGCNRDRVEADADS
jgi:hypothetical protein